MKETEHDDFLNEMEQHLEFESLRFSCGTLIFCPLCKKVLDCHDAVDITLTENAEKQRIFTRVICATCYDAKCDCEAALKAAKAKSGTDWTMKVTDGREYDEDGWYIGRPFTIASEQSEFVTRRNGEPPMLVKGHKVEFKADDWISREPWFVYLNEKDKRWYLTHVDAGAAAGHGQTESSAVFHALQTLRNAGEEMFRKAMRRVQGK